MNRPEKASLPHIRSEMELRERITLLHDQLKDRLAPSDNEQISEFIQVGEWGLGFETMCDQLVEYDAMTSSSEWEDILLLSRDMGLDPTSWNSIRPGAR